MDVLISSQEFPRRLTGIDDEHAALVEMKTRLRPDAVVETHGYKKLSFTAFDLKWLGE